MTTTNWCRERVAFLRRDTTKGPSGSGSHLPLLWASILQPSLISISSLASGEIGIVSTSMVTEHLASED